MGGPKLTARERKAVAALQRLAKDWPETLWLNSNGGLSVWKRPEGMTGEDPRTPCGGLDPDYCVCGINGIEATDAT